MYGVALKYFVEVAATGSLSAASERLFVAVSAISRQISKLEAQVGSPLFERAPRGMVLSEAGQMLLAHTRRTLLESEAVLHEIACLKGALGGKIRVACTEGPAQHFLPSMFRSFRQHYPDTRFDLHVCAPSAATRRVAEGGADVAVTFNIEQSRGVVVHHSEDAPVCAVMSRKHPLAGLEAVTLAQLCAYPIAMGDVHSSTRKLLAQACRMEGIELDPVLVSNYAGALLSFARSGDGVMLGGHAPLTGALAHEGLVGKRIDSPEIYSRNLQIVTMEGRLLPKAVDEFVRHLIAALHTPVSSAKRTKSGRHDTQGDEHAALA